MLKRYVEQILSLYNYIDGVVITDKKAHIVYITTYRPDINSINGEYTIGKHILDIYPKLTEETSSIMTVLKTGEPIYNQFQELITYKGECIKAVNTTLPIIIDGEIEGAIDVSRYVDDDCKRNNITISINEKDATKDLYDLEDIVTRAPSMEVIKKKIPLIAETDSSVLIYGETGTGKELVAQSIHSCSSRRNKKFVSQNCAAIPSNLLESILFGTVKGSYTGAENRPGLFEIANGGTIFLDEINSMELHVQSKILKAIEEKQITRLGKYDPIKIDVKIVSAMNVDPLQCVAEKKIREDLFYRLSVVQLNLPPLRERREDIMYLVNYFIKYYNKRMNRNILSVDTEVERVFMRHDWKGNVRELKNVIEGAFNISSKRIIERKDLPEYMLNFIEPYTAQYSVKAIDMKTYDFGENKFEEGTPLETIMAEYEKKLIIEVIKNSKSTSEAARKLGVSRQALRYKMSKYHIE